VSNKQTILDFRFQYRYQAVLMRDKFEKNRNLKDQSQIQLLMNEGEKELFLKQHPQPRKFANSPGGVAFEREVEPPDWIVDYWHPLEKAQYPEYFARREERKKQWLDMWDKKYGKGTGEQHHH
jgi:NADH dehydrogenase (ubiquinone) 1 beta subcomplex subunit 9